MKKIMFNDKYGLTQAVLEGRKTQTRRTFLKSGEETLLDGITPEYLISVRSRYKVGETIAIAQPYADITPQVDWVKCMIRKETLGWNNKMFVRSEDMPHHIRITKIRIERLQDIKSEDCLKEGLWMAGEVGLEGTTYWYHGLANSSFHTPQEAYASLIDSIFCKGTWASNPYVFVYDFELID